MDLVIALRQIAYYKDRAREDSRRVMAYRNAADIVEALDETERERHGQANSWQSLPGIGPKTIETRLAAIGKKVQTVVNYDNCYLAPDLTDAYVTLVRRLAEHYYADYYAAVTRYTTSSMRLKLSEQLSNRGLAPHIYESRQEAMDWNKKLPPR